MKGGGISYTVVGRRENVGTVGKDIRRRFGEWKGWVNVETIGKKGGNEESKEVWYERIEGKWWERVKRSLESVGAKGTLCRGNA